MNRPFAVFLVAVLVLAGILVALGRLSHPTAEPAGGSSRRIVSTNRHATEILFAIGAGQMVAGVCRYCEWPPEARVLPKVGGYQDLDLEQLASIAPDLVVLQAGAKVHDEAVERMRHLGIETISIPAETLEDQFQAIADLGQATGHTAEADELASRIRRDIDDVRALVEGRTPRRVLVLLGREADELRGISAVGRETFLDDLLKAAGGVNVLPPKSGRYPRLSAEDVLAAAPEVILELHVGRSLSAGEKERLADDWAPLAAVPAVAGGRIEFATEDYLLVNGPRVGLIARRFAVAVHPEVAPE